MVKRCATTLLLLVFAWPALAGVTANVDRSRLFDDETLELTIRADFPVADQALDLTALSQLFDIVQQRQSTQARYSTRNGREQWREWILTLRPKHVGTLAIPHFQFGDEQTQPIMVTVLDADDRQDGLPEDAVVLNAQLGDESLYIGQTTTLTVELDYQVRLQGNFDTFSPDGFDAELIDESNSIHNLNGRQVRRYTLVYRLTPTRSGAVTVPEIQFSGQYQAGQFDTTRRLTRRHPGFALTVKPVPDAFPDGAPWLPATSLSLEDNLPQALTLNANEHLDWTITTRAGGLNATQLPDPLAAFEGGAFRLYRNAPEFNDDGPLSQRKDLNALVFNEPGQYRLPAVRIPWWNLTTDRLEYAELPARPVEVRADLRAVAQPSVPVEPQPQAVQQTETTGPFWPWLAVSLGVGWLATVLGWVAVSQRRTVPTAPAEREPTRLPPALADLTKHDTPKAFYAALATWSQKEHGVSLQSIAARLPKDARIVFERLESSLFGRQPTDPPSVAERRALLKAIETAGREGPAQTTREPDQLY